MPSERPAVIEGLDVNEVKDGLIVYDDASDRVHYLNGAAAVIFTLCDGQHDLAALAQILAQTSKTDADRSADVEECLGALRKEGLLR